MKITLLNIKIEEYTLNMIFNSSCDRKLRCIKNWNAQWEIWLVHSHENLIFTFVLLLNIQNGAMWAFLHFSHWVKNNYAYQRSAPWGFAEILKDLLICWLIWRVLCTIIETRWRFYTFNLTYLGYKNWKWVIFLICSFSGDWLAFIFLAFILDYVNLKICYNIFHLFFEEQRSEKLNFNTFLGSNRAQNRHQTYCFE